MDTTTTLWKAGNSFIRTARTPWPCNCRLREWHGETEEGKGNRCNIVIARGERYLESVDSAPAYQSGDRYCWTCAEHQGLIGATQPWRHAYVCRLTYMDQQRTDPKSCVCGGRADDWYEVVA